ncbi:MAG: EamA family transporter [Halodesulfurarchaeum sp.]
MLRSAVLFGIVAMLGWGLWSVLAKLATRSLPPALAMVVSYATGAVIALGYVYAQRGSLTLPVEGVLLAGIAGVFAGIGGVAFYMGLNQGRAAVVTTVSALYFVVAALIGVVVLGETIDLYDVGGIGFAVLAVVLLAR